MSTDHQREDFLLELDGPGVHRDSVDSAKLLAFASAYFDLLRKIAASHDHPIGFHGLEVIEKCVAIKVNPDDSGYAKDLADTSASYLGDRRPKEFASLVEKVRGALRAFPTDCTAKVIVGPWERTLAVPAVQSKPNFPAAIETMRANVMRVGGAEPGARLRGILDEKQFTVDVSLEQAKSLGNYLYKDVDVVVRAVRSASGAICQCKLMEFTPVSDIGDSTAAMREWFRPHADFWDTVADIPEALGRRDRS